MKKRHYTMQQMGDSLALTIKGKFLAQEFGLHTGDYFQLIQEQDRLILIKQPKEDTPLEQAKPSNSVGKPTYLDRLAKRAVSIN